MTAMTTSTITATTIKLCGGGGGSVSLEISTEHTLSDVLHVLFFLDLKFVNNCKFNTAGKITLNAPFRVVNNTLLPGFRWIVFPKSALYFSGSPYYKNRFAL